MSGCRIARRIASMTLPESACSDAVSVRTLATKVFHYPFQSFLPRRERLPAGARWLAVVSFNNGPRASVGVTLFSWQGSTRRVGCSVTPVATPFITASLVTKGKKGDKK
jgi:hypothetical protein